MDGTGSEDRPVFEKAVVDAAISGMCALFDALEMTLLERWYASRCVCVAATAVMEPGIRELVERLEDALSDE